MLDNKLQTPLYIQLRDILAKQIQNGFWQVDSQLPTEQALCEECGISRITVRQALEALEQDDLIYRKRGKGTFVKSPGLEQRLFSVYSFSEQIANCGRQSGSHVLEISRQPCGEEEAGYLHITPGDRVTKLHRLRLVDNEPFALETSYLPCALSEKVTADDVTRDGLYKTLKRYYNIAPDVVEESFEAVMIHPRMQGPLKLGKNSPGIHLQRVAKWAGIPFEYCDCFIRGDRYKYSVVLRRD